MLYWLYDIPTLLTVALFAAVFVGVCWLMWYTVAVGALLNMVPADGQSIPRRSRRVVASLRADLSADDDGVGAEGLSGQRVLLGDRAVGVEPVDEGAGCGKFDLHDERAQRVAVGDHDHALALLQCGDDPLLEERHDA